MDNIDYIIFSYIYYNYVRLSKDFTNNKTKFIVSNDALDLLYGKLKYNLGKHMIFELDLLPLERTLELSTSSIADLYFK